MALSTTAQQIQLPKLLKTGYTIHDEFAARVTISMCEIVWGVVRDCDLVTKLKIAKFFPDVFVGDSQKISCYTVY